MFFAQCAGMFFFYKKLILYGGHEVRLHVIHQTPIPMVASSNPMRGCLPYTFLLLIVGGQVLIPCDFRVKGNLTFSLGRVKASDKIAS